MIMYVMGVAGCGKSTIGQLLADSLSIPFFDADDFHPAANIAKMSAGQALNDQDRLPWLENIADAARKAAPAGGAVFACSALKAAYRQILDKDIPSDVHWIFLEGSQELIRSRMEQRTDHFMPPALLQSQFDALETPASAIAVSIDASPNQIVQHILHELEQRQR